MPKRLELGMKRLFDLGASLTLLILLAPALALIAILIRTDSGGPVFFTQERSGLKGRPFRIYKFRTMIAGAERIGPGVFTGAGDSRITRVGRVLRRWSLDELPQLLNVVKGEMSIIGPRPTLPYQVAKYDGFQRQRLLAKPGLTGWAQVNGRNALTWPERIQLDVWYVAHWSLWLDGRILLLTLPAVWRPEGLYDRGADEISRLPEKTPDGRQPGGGER